MAPAPAATMSSHGSDDVLEDRLLEGATTGEPVPVIVHFEGPNAREQARNVEGMDVQYVFQSIPSVYGYASPSVVRTLAEWDVVRFIEDAHKRIEFLLDTATIASRAKEVWDPSFDPHDDLVDEASPDLSAEVGERVDGSGVGLAIVDTGLDATHPDFQATGKVGGNYQVTSAGVVEGGPYTARASSHGTAVAGVAAGIGAASDGQHVGAAPGSTLYSFSAITATGAEHSFQEPEPTGITVNPAIAFDWILQNGDDLFPAIGVVSNSWYCAAAPCQTFNPDMAHIRLASALADNGTFVTWAAGDFGGASVDSELTAEARNPTPGIVGVASYNDRNLGTRDSCVADFSAQGNPDDASTWPDLAAPGSQITTTATARLESSATALASQYGERTGTSMAAPHVAGVAALMLQANPSLSPAEIERVLENTAHELSKDCYEETLPAELEDSYIKADPTNPTDGANWKVGHGLVDAMNAVETALTFEGLPDDEPEPRPVPDEYDGTLTGFDITERFYLADGGKLVQERPTDDEPGRSVQAPNETAVFTSEPLDEPLTTAGIDLAVWIGTLNENLASPVGAFDGIDNLEYTIERVDETGTVTDRFILDSNYWYRDTADPQERDDFEVLEGEFGTESVTFEKGEKIRLKIDVRDPYGAKPTGDVLPWVLEWGSQDSPSSIGLGPAEEHNEMGSKEACRQFQPKLCAWLNANYTEPFYRCEARGTFRVVWYGPPGSSAVLNCQHGSATCSIPQDADGWERCESTSMKISGSARRAKTVECTYDVPDGTPPKYHGRCTTVNSP